VYFKNSNTKQKPKNKQYAIKKELGKKNDTNKNLKIARAKTRNNSTTTKERTAQQQQKKTSKNKNPDLRSKLSNPEK
jgi:hypothetical protein